MVKLRGFRFSMNLSGLKKEKDFEDNPYQPQYSTITGAYKINYDEFIAPTSSLPPVNRITPSMVTLPTSKSKPNMAYLKPNEDRSQGNNSTIATEQVQAVKSILKIQQTSQETSMNTQVAGNSNIRPNQDDYIAPPPMTPKSDTVVSNNPKGAQSSKITKPNTKEQKKLEKERKRFEKQQAVAAKKEVIAQKKQQQQLKKQQEKEAKIAIQKEKANKKKTAAPKLPANKRAANPLAQNSNPLAQTPQSSQSVDPSPAPVQNTTPESTISRTKGPPPYSEAINSKVNPADLMQSEIDPTGNTSFGKPVDLGSWDLISQHRQQIGRPAPNTSMATGSAKPKQIVMDLKFPGNDPRKSVDA